MNATDKAKLLALVSSGHDPESAAIAVGADLSLVNKPKPQLKKALAAALRVARARLRGKIMELALEGNNVQALERQLERLEAKTDTGGLQRIERVIISAKCEACGHRPSLAPSGNGKKQPAKLSDRRSDSFPEEGGRAENPAAG